MASDPPRGKAAEGDPLHDLLERVGDEVDILERVDRGYRRVGRRMIFGMTVLTVACAVALKTSHDAQVRTDRTADIAANNTAELQLVTAQNRQFINRLEAVARQAQENGAATSQLQCHTINRVLRSIRFVLNQSPDSAPFAAGFKALNCRKLPNAKPVAP